MLMVMERGAGPVRFSEKMNILPGVTAVIGSGGKTTLLLTLGRELAERGSVLLCTTTKFLPFPDLPCARTEAELRDLTARHRLLCAGTPAADGSGKLGPLEVSMSDLAQRFDYVLAEADGAKGRPLKAHAAWEPVIPLGAAVIHVLGASGFGRPISQAVHRPERYALLAGVSEDDPATAETEAAVLLAEGLPGTLFLNQAESEAAAALGARLARLLQGPVLAGSLLRGECRECWW